MASIAETPIVHEGTKDKILQDLFRQTFWEFIEYRGEKINGFQSPKSDITSEEVEKRFRKLPWWVKKVILIKEKATASGSFKTVYIYNNEAIAVAKDTGRTNVSIKKLFEFDRKKLDKKEIAKAQKLKDRIERNVIYPQQTKKYFGYLFHKMPVCNKYTLMRIITDAANFDTYVHTTEGQYKELIQALSILHEKHVFIGDLKPENILKCNGHLSFIDMDDVVYLPPEDKIKTEKNTVKQDVITTGWWDVLSWLEHTKYNRYELMLNDWNAMALIILISYDINNRSYMEEQKILSKKKFSFTKRPKINYTGLSGVLKSHVDYFSGYTSDRWKKYGKNTGERIEKQGDMTPLEAAAADLVIATDEYLRTSEKYDPMSKNYYETHLEEVIVKFKTQVPSASRKIDVLTPRETPKKYKIWQKIKAKFKRTVPKPPPYKETFRNIIQLAIMEGKLKGISADTVNPRKQLRYQLKF